MTRQRAARVSSSAVVEPNTLSANSSSRRGSKKTQAVSANLKAWAVPLVTGAVLLHFARKAGARLLPALVRTSGILHCDKQAIAITCIELVANAAAGHCPPHPPGQLTVPLRTEACTRSTTSAALGCAPCLCYWLQLAVAAVCSQCDQVVHLTCSCLIAPLQLPKRIGGGSSGRPGMPGGRKPAIVWFRNDLRLHDHEPLAAAGSSATSLLPVYIFDPREYGKVGDCAAAAI